SWLTPGPAGSVGRDSSTGNLCFESASVTLRPRNSDPPSYTEIELGPHGHYLALRLRGIRQPHRQVFLSHYSARIDGQRWSAQARLPWVFLPRQPFLLNAYAIHGVGEHRRYLAMSPVPGDGPDFHRLEYFTRAWEPGI
ncbi:MAG: hypothetical protein HN348_31635, partial [Proteobacteria bacterium]|nr:hypothetical protein [Pseudomonadota bacterium]